MKGYLFGDEEYIKLTDLIDFASKEDNNEININGRLYQSLQHGHWEAHAVSIRGVPTEACSVCGEWTYGDCARFCPNCGAIMDEEVEEDEINEAPTVNAEPIRYGHWIYNPKDAFEVMFELPKCSVCKHESSDALKYCPNCGAKMIEADTEAMYYPQVEGITPTVIEVEEDGVD